MTPLPGGGRALTRSDREGLEMLAESPRYKINCNGGGCIGGLTAARLVRRHLAEYVDDKKAGDRAIVIITEKGRALLANLSDASTQVTP